MEEIINNNEDYDFDYYDPRNAALRRIQSEINCCRSMLKSLKNRVKNTKREGREIDRFLVSSFVNTMYIITNLDRVFTKLNH